MLDGGHMFFYALEMVRGKPLPEAVMNGTFFVGKILVYALMLFVVLKDLWKYLLMLFAALKDSWHALL